MKPFESLPCNEELVNDIWTVCFDYYDNQLINVVTCIHGEGFFHGSLKKKKNYVMGEKSLKIINFDGSLEGIDVTYQDKSKNDDFLDIKSMLAHLLESLLAPETPSSKEKMVSYVFFDYIHIWNYSKFVSKLIGHPFLKSPEHRLK
ncbi:hypothetical protein L3X38_033025 [Prunus dulcis]|uniref:Uncharacterized protein n=1 Tax=Prunus dulcis TaxID=3755 RepID=A0AAD4VGV7_PRUDU|nr:hypothetical protein L3X38_033025 [Prunus dulcis]